MERELGRLPVIVLLDNVRSAHNVGLVFRLCDCVGVQALWLAGITAYPGVSERADARIAKTAVGGSLDALPWRHFDDPLSAVHALKRAGWRVATIEQGAGSTPWTEMDDTPPLLIVLGHEREGVRDELIGVSDEVVELPVRGVTNSLNVALCASAVLYRLLERHGSRRPPRAGLCAGCAHARVVRSDRGAAYLLCGAAAGDASLERYPQLPVEACHGYLPAEEGEG